MLPRPAVLRPVHHLADVCGHLLPALVPHHQLPRLLGIHAHTICHIVPAAPFHHLNQTRRTNTRIPVCPAPTAHVHTPLADLVRAPTHAHFSSKAGDVLRHSGITTCGPLNPHLLRHMGPMTPPSTCCCPSWLTCCSRDRVATHATYRTCPPAQQLQKQQAKEPGVAYQPIKSSFPGT